MNALPYLKSNSFDELRKDKEPIYLSIPIISEQERDLLRESLISNPKKQTFLFLKLQTIQKT